MPVDDVSNVPADTLTFAAVVKELPRVHPPPTPLKLRFPPIDTPLVVTVLPVVVALNVIVPAELHTVPATSDIEPLTASVGDVP